MVGSIRQENPLEDPSTLRSPKAVMIQGQWIEKGALEEMKEKGYQHGSGFGTFMRYAWFIVTK